MRKVWFFTDDYGNLCRGVEVSTCWFWYPAVNKKEHALFVSWGNYDDWGALKEKT
jgi:hypothetical protein